MDIDIMESAVELRHELHRCAELSGRERNTKQRLMDFLSRVRGLEIHDMGQWFYAVYRTHSNNGRNIAFRADFDALPIAEGAWLDYHSENPDVSHRCGHDGHSSALAAFAIHIDRYGSENNIFFLFQHAEETGEGARECCQMILDGGIDEIYAFHNMPGKPYGSIAVHTGVAACASKGMIISFTGRTSHASQPELGLNPAFAIAKLILSLREFTSPMRGTERQVSFFDKGNNGMMLCSIVGVRIGEGAFGACAGFGKLMLTIRAEHECDMYKLETEITRLANEYAREDGLSVRIDYSDEFPETRNTPLCAERVREVCRKLNIPLATWDEPFRSSEDFGYYTRLTKGALFYIGNGEEYAPLHTTEYDFPDSIIETAVSVFCKLAE